MHAQRSPRSARACRALLGVAVLGVLALAALALPQPLSPAHLALAEETSPSVDSSATTLAPLPERMARIGDAQQLVVATGAKLGSRTGTLQFFDYVDGAWVCTMSVPCRFGKRGLMDGTRRWAGNKTTPTGLWKMPTYVFGRPYRAPAGSKMGYRRITWKSWWSSKRGRTYNTWVEARRWPGEKLSNARVEYEYAVSTGYNAKPNRVVYGRGTGIFLHIYGSGYTAGCISISRANMLRVTKLLDPAKRPAFAIGTLATGTPTSILAY
jgi:L,D-peptidoglycan transpeptidase YkuD (ErfK/YbiS/YcfS/YnhG family)